MNGERERVFFLFLTFKIFLLFFYWFKNKVLSIQNHEAFNWYFQILSFRTKYRSLNYLKIQWYKKVSCLLWHNIALEIVRYIFKRSHPMPLKCSDCQQLSEDPVFSTSYYLLNFEIFFGHKNGVLVPGYYFNVLDSQETY